MANRNFSMIDYFNKIAEDWQPILSFENNADMGFTAWHQKAMDKYLQLLGEFPEPVPLDPEIVFSIEHDGLIRQRVVFDSEEHMSVPCVVLRPSNMAENNSSAAIVCSHGHGPYGKEPVAGNDTTPDRSKNIAEHNYNYGELMAREGYLTISPDLRVFGERDDGGNPYPGRDRCNIHFIRGAIMGIYTLTLNIWDMMRCVDYLHTRPEVSPERIGMMGLSQGGTMTTFTAAADDRFKCADIIGYINPWERFGVNNANFCGSQIVPQIYRYFDTHDIAGLIAPRPLMVEMGVHDTCFHIDHQLQGFKKLQKIYDAAEVGDDLWADIHPGGHEFAGNKAYEFFDEYL